MIDCNNFEHVLLLYETMDGMKSNSAVEMSLKELLEENKEIVQRMRIRTRPKARKVLEFFSQNNWPGYETLVWKKF